MSSKFRDRRDAGKVLSHKLLDYSQRAGVVVLALPRGGVPVGYEVAKALNAPLDVFLVRKLGLPGYEELAMGAIGSGGIRVLNESVLSNFSVSSYVLDAVTRREEEVLREREALYRGDKPPMNFRGKTVILVDDGLATGSTMRAAVAALRTKHPQRVIVAVPIAAPETCQEFQDEVDDIVCARTPARFQAVGRWYDDFSQTSDAEVRDLLEAAARENEVEV